MFAHPVTVATDVDHMAVVHQSINQRGRHHVIAKDRAPFLEALVEGQHGGGVFIARIDQLEDQYGAVAADRQITDRIDDQQGRMTQHAQPSGQLAGRGYKRGVASVVVRDELGIRWLAQM